MWPAQISVSLRLFLISIPYVVYNSITSGEIRSQVMLGCAAKSEAAGDEDGC